MIETWKTISATASLSAVLLLGSVTAPLAADPNNGAASTQSTVESTTAPAAATPADKSTDKTAVATPKKQKSVLDAESLESPLSFFRDITSPDEDDSDITVKPGAMMLALKALVATLLSTIM